jgi:hypothetical protein
MHGNVGKIRGMVDMPPAQAGQPAPFFKGFGARAVKTQTAEHKRPTSLRVKLVHTTVHFKPGVRADIANIAEKQGHSFSQVVNDACEFFAEATLEEKYKASLSTEFRKIIREELQAFGYRLIYFLRRIAFSAEHARLLATNVLKILLQSRGKYNETHFRNLVDTTGKTANRNILRNTPGMKAGVAEYWDSYPGDATKAESNTGQKEANP